MGNDITISKPPFDDNKARENKRERDLNRGVSISSKRVIGIQSTNNGFGVFGSFNTPNGYGSINTTKIAWTWFDKSSRKLFRLIDKDLNGKLDFSAIKCYVQHAMQIGNNDEETVEAEARKVLLDLGLAASAKISEATFVLQLREAYKKDCKATTEAVKRALDIMRSYTHQVCHHSQTPICTIRSILPTDYTYPRACFVPRM